jgi:hypothetical protein
VFQTARPRNDHRRLRDEPVEALEFSSAAARVRPRDKRRVKRKSF